MFNLERAHGRIDHLKRALHSRVVDVDVFHAEEEKGGDGWRGGVGI